MLAHSAARLRDRISGLSRLDKEELPMQFALKPLLLRIWHAPDNLRLMDPLPLPHRRGIIIGALAIVLGVLLPSTGDDRQSAGRETPIDMQTPHPDVMPDTSQPQQTAPINPQPIDEGEPGNDAPMPQAQYQQLESQAPQVQTSPQQPASTPSSEIPYQDNSAQQWRSYRIESGKTLAQLFRDNNLPPADVYAMAQAEGPDKPLSNLQTGQMVKIRQNANGVVTGLTIDMGDNQQVLFTRQPNGSFIQAR